VDDRLMKFALLVILALMLWRPSAAQATPIMPLTPYEGTITVPGETQSWSFSGQEGGVVSVLVTSTGELDPVLELRNSSGQVLITNDDFAYPGRRDALLQAITLPRIDTYTASVYGFGDTIGDYTLTLFPGYGETALDEDFEPFTGWQADGTDSAALESVDGGAVLTLDGVRELARVERSGADMLEDFFAQVSVNVQRGRGWRAGLALRGTDDGYYALALGESGSWRLDYISDDGAARQVRDWTAHPAIVAGASRFTFGVLVNGATFDVFYNGAWVGQAVETQTDAPDVGQAGLYGGTSDAVGSGMVAAYDDFMITLPLRLGETEIMPTALVPGGQALTVQELERRRVIPTGGNLALNVPESSGRQVEPGVNRVLLGRGAAFGDYVLHTSFTLTTGSPESLVGCGLLLGNLSETEHAVAFLDRRGGYGISARDGENYEPGLFGENEAFAGGQRHTLVVVKQGTRAELFVDRQHVGGLDLPGAMDAPAQIGNAVINYERSDTSCNFSDTWVWSLPSAD
jgi:hypothetical protein